MKIEKLRNNHKKEIIIGTMLTVVIGGALTFKLTHSKYRVTQSIDLGSGVINYKVPDFKIMAMYKSDNGSSYSEITTMPSSGYVINESKTYCQTSSGSQVTGKIYTNSSGEQVFKNLNKGDKCYLYFDLKKKTIDEIIASLNAKTSTPTFSSLATSDEGVYRTADGTNMYGTSTYTYYWRGAATTNHVIFANKCWRIVRINGDKTMRLIHNGTPTSGTCADFGSGAVIMGSTNAEKYYATSDGKANNPSYVGWKYQLSSQRPTNTTSGTDSNAKVQTQKWYDTNIGNNPTYSAKVADGKFCNDREIGSGSWNTGSTTFRYAGYTRLGTNKTPTFNCSNANDVYTLKVGAITADELAFAGGVNEQNNESYYLKGDNAYWTMSPLSWSGVGVNVFVVFSSGYLSNTGVSGTTFGLRPVINLKADTTFASGGTGTQNNPYVVS